MLNAIYSTDTEPPCSLILRLKHVSVKPNEKNTDYLTMVMF